MLGIWLVGFEEHSPEESGEICIAELFGHAIGPVRSQVRTGIKAHHDPKLVTEMLDAVVDIDATQPQSYACAWNDEGVRCYVDDQLIFASRQALRYPQQLMVDLFEFPDSARRPDDAYPKQADVLSVRGYQRR